MDRVQQAADLAEAGELDDAWDIVDKVLVESPDDVRAVVCATFICDQARKLPLAYAFAHRAVQLAPDLIHAWVNLGRMEDQLYRLDSAVERYAKAYSLCKSGKQKAFVAMNWAAVLITRGEFDKAEELAKEALRYEPESIKAQSNYGMACLGQGKWREGWANYGKMLGVKIRPETVYGDEPTWDGSANKVVAVYGEQGLGDEIAFASMLPDAVKRAGRVILDCDKRLEHLMRRSFPFVTVYGTRGKKQAGWSETDKKIDARIAIGHLGHLFRNETADFPGTPYLKADPERVAMWRHLFAKKERPVIGIAWTGGVQHTAAQLRRVTLDQLAPILTAIPAHWVSLQYIDASAEIKAWNEKSYAPIHQYAYATLTRDYDDTAALVDACDLVITMQTAIVHLAGGLGKQALVMVPKEAQWRYGMSGETIPWYKSVRIVRQSKSGDWDGVIQKIARFLKEEFQQQRAA